MAIRRMKAKRQVQGACIANFGYGNQIELRRNRNRADTVKLCSSHNIRAAIENVRR